MSQVHYEVLQIKCDKEMTKNENVTEKCEG